VRSLTAPAVHGRSSPRGDEVAAGSLTPRPLVHLVATRTVSGATVVQVTRMATRQAERGLSVGVIARPQVVHALGRDSGVRRSALPVRSPFDPVSVFRVRRVFDLWSPAVVHAHGVAALLAARLALAGKPPVPLIVTRRLAFPINPAVAGVLRGRAVSAIVASCRAVANIVAASAGLPPGRVRVCVDGADVPWLEEAAAQARDWRAKAGLAEANPLVVHVGVRSWRGGGEMLKAWSGVLRRLPRAYLLLAGCSIASDREEVLDLAAEMGVGGSVAVTSAGLEAPELLAAADVVADASWAGAGVSTAVRDAMALGKPVVAVARDGNLELLQAGISGLLVPPRDAPTLAAAVIRLATDQALAVRLASAAQLAIRRHWSLAVQLGQLEELHQHLGVRTGAGGAVRPADT